MAASAGDEEAENWDQSYSHGQQLFFFGLSMSLLLFGFLFQLFRYKYLFVMLFPHWIHDRKVHRCIATKKSLLPHFDLLQSGPAVLMAHLSFFLLLGSEWNSC